MDKETLKISERDRSAKRRAEEKARRIIWRTDFRKQQSEAKAKTWTLLGWAGISKMDLDYLCRVVKSRHGPYPDQIERIDKLWAKYGFQEKEQQE